MLIRPDWTVMFQEERGGGSDSCGQRPAVAIGCVLLWLWLIFKRGVELERSAEKPRLPVFLEMKTKEQ